MAGPLTGVACGLYVLFKGAFGGGLGEACIALDEDEGGSLLGAAVFLFEILLGRDNELGCLRASTLPVAATLLMDAYLMIAILFGTNMLIALLVKSLDSKHEQQATNYMYFSALQLVSWCRAPVVPMPFALLGFPYTASLYGFSYFSIAYRKCFAKCSWAVTGVPGFESQGDDLDPSRVSEVPVLKAQMMAYLHERAGDLADSGKWRMQVGSQLSALDEKLVLLTKQQAKSAELGPIVQHLFSQQLLFAQHQEHMSGQMTQVIEQLATLTTDDQKQKEQLSKEMVQMAREQAERLEKQLVRHTLDDTAVLLSRLSSLSSKLEQQLSRPGGGGGAGATPTQY